MGFNLNFAGDPGDIHDGDTVAASGNQILSPARL